MGSSGSLPEVEVLLATYNGERFLREQIDSILNQDYANLRVLARDDGSTDGTVSILKEYEERFPGRFRLMPPSAGTGGAKLNFLILMKESTADYVCFADQDDVWLPTKVSLTWGAVERLVQVRGADIPLLVFTDLRVVDQDGATLHPSFWQRSGLEVQNVNRLARVLGENPVTGCTVMMNRNMCDLAKQMPEEATMHDRWVGLLAAALGAAEAMPVQTVLYRQHDRNAIGSRHLDDSMAGLAARAAKSGNRRSERKKSEAQVEALLRVHGAQMTAEHRDLLEAYIRSGRSASAWTRLATTLKYGFYRSGFLRTAATIWDLWRARSVD